MLGKLKPRQNYICPEQKKSFYKYIHNKRKIRKNVGSLQKETWLPGIWRRLRYSVSSVFSGNCSKHITHITESKGREWESEEPPTAGDGV